MISINQVVLEGPVLLSTNFVKTEEIREFLGKFLCDAVEKNTLSNDPKTAVLLLSGIHGGEDGVDGLTDEG
jgi:hypothetical protein